MGAKFSGFGPVEDPGSVLWVQVVQGRNAAAMREWACGRTGLGSLTGYVWATGWSPLFVFLLDTLEEISDEFGLGVSGGEFQDFFKGV